MLRSLSSLARRVAPLVATTAAVVVLMSVATPAAQAAPPDCTHANKQLSTEQGAPAIYEPRNDCSDPLGLAGRLITYSVSTDPEHGNVSVGSSPNFVMSYAPAAGYAGPDSFVVQAYVGGASTTYTVDVEVEAPGGNVRPNCPNKRALVSGPASARSHTNLPSCPDADFDALSFAIVDQPANGTLADVGGNQFLYEPMPGSTASTGTA